MADRLTLGDLVYKLGFQNEQEFIRELERTFDRGEKEAAESGRQAGRKFSDSFESVFSGAAVGSFLGTVFAQVLQQASQAVQQFARESVQAFASYEQGLVQLRLAGVENLEPIEERIQAIAEASGVFSKIDVSVGVGNLVKAGFDVEQALTLVAKSANLAASEVDPLTGRFGDLSSIAAQSGQILRAMNLDFSETGRVIDVIAKAAQDSSADITDMVDAIAVVGPFASQAGLSIEQVSAAIATLTNQGIPAAEAGRGLRSVLTALIDPPAQVREQFDRLGITLITADGRTRDFNEVLDNLGAIANSGTQGVQLLARGMDTFAISTAASLGASSDAVNTFAGELEGAEGAAQNLADTVRDSTAAELATLEARLMDAKAALGEELAPAMVDLYEDVLPPLVAGLKEAIQLWNDAHFLFTGSSPQLENQRDSFLSGLTEEARAYVLALEAVMAAEEEVALRERILGNTPVGDRRARRAQQNLDEAKFQLAQAQAQLREATLALRAAREEGNDQPTGGDDPPPPDPPPTDPPPTPPPGSSRPSAPPIDPLIDEAQRVGRDASQRLRLLYETGRISAEEYEDFLAAHLRRLNGLYEQAGTPEQVTAVLRPAEAIQRELERLEAERQQTAEERREEEQERQRAHGEEMLAIARDWLTRRLEEGTALLGEWEALAAEFAARRERREGHEQQKLITAQQQYQDSRLAAQDLAAEREARRQENAQQRALYSQMQYQGSRLEALRLANEQAEREAEQAARNRQAAFEREVRGLANRVGDWLSEGVAGLQELAGSTQAQRIAGGLASVFERAEGAVVRFVQAQRALGEASRKDVIQALRDQITAIEALLPLVDVGSERYYELAAAIAEARRELDGLTEGKPVPDIEGEGDEEIDDGLEDMQNRLQDIAMSFPRALIQGLREGDVGAALQSALGSAADFFLDQMLKAILGPITQQLAAAMTTNAVGGAAGAAGGLGALGPWGIVAGIGLLAFSLMQGGRDRARTEVRDNRNGNSTGGAPEITYNLNATVNVSAGADFNDPSFYARWRTETENLVIGLLERARRVQGE